MWENPNIVDDVDTKQHSLSVSLHPDDAKDKVFRAILQALLKLDNKPSSPKELSNVIMTSGFANLGGQTPFATVSSRISQHFKRAAQHKPPRSPLLTRHVDSLHSRKVHYSLATESLLPSPSPTPSSPESQQSPPTSSSRKIQPQQKSKKREVVQILSLDTPAGQTKNKRRRIQNRNTTNKKSSKKSIPSSPIAPVSPKSPTQSVSNYYYSTSDDDDDAFTISNSIDSEDDSSDYHQDMLNESLSTFDEFSDTTTIVSQQFTNDQTINHQSTINNTNALWTNDDNDNFGLEHIPDSSTAHHLSFNIDAPETVSIAELDDYFGNDNELPTTHSAPPPSTANNTMHLYEESVISYCPLNETYPKAESIDNHCDSSQHIHHDQNHHSQSTSSQETLSLYNELVRVPSNDTLSKDTSPHPIFDQSDDKDYLQDTINIISSPHHMISDSQQSIQSSTTCIADKFDDDIFIHFDDDADDESDMFKDNLPTHPAQNVESTTASLNITTLTKLLDLMHDKQADFTTLQQIITTTPELKYLSTVTEQIKSLATYLQQQTTTTTNVTDTCSSSSQPSNDSNEFNSQQHSDINAIFTQFPALKLLLNKQQNISEKQLPLSSEETIMVKTITSTNPTMYITLIDDIPVCVAILPSTLNTPEYHLMRRLDLDYVNGTTLLKAGGVDTEYERSIIFSLEQDRLRIRRHDSILNGTWIPLKRAQRLAATCSMEHQLGSFLDDTIESHFPSPLPPDIVNRQQIKPNLSKYPLSSSFWYSVDSDRESSPTSGLSSSVSLVGDSDDDHSTFIGNFWTGTPRRSLSLPGSSSTTSSDTFLSDQPPNYNNNNGNKTTFGSTTDDNDGSTDDSTDSDTESETEEERRQTKRKHDAAILAMEMDDFIYAQKRSKTVPAENKRHELASRKSNKTPMCRRSNSSWTSTAIVKSASWNGSTRRSPPQQSLFTPETSTRYQGISNNTRFPSVPTGSPNSSSSEELDIGGHGYGDDLR